MTEKVICTVYRSPRKEGMYLYVERKTDLERVPEALLARFGEPQRALTLVLTPDRRLARENAATVLRNLRDEGYHLQLPPLLHSQLDAFRDTKERGER